jgi:hypothetical protein
MSGDYTRFTFKPQRDYSGVFKQQGRVDLDADFNELIEIIDRRWRSETLDIVNHCVVPNTTPDAFLVTPTAMGAFDIGIGRMYVDGIQVENHGRPPLAFQSDLGDMLGTTQVPYRDQPYLPAPLPPALLATPTTTDLVYIDVWQREVTVLEDPTLREIALGGPDTTTRIQSVWQVRALQNVGTHGCGDDIAAWDALTAPSAGRLTTSAVAPPAADDPCIISPAGGYRGLENRLYRVEIHSTGPIGGGLPAKFKWSRINATIASSVSAIPSPTQITVQQVGRDQVLRFEVGNFVEITDDFREFQGLTGHMARITAIDEANRVLDFTPAIPAAMNFNAADPSRHTRVRRWDQTLNVDANGLLDVVAGPIDIEDGIQVTFNLSPLTGNFKVGDFWVFAARTADGSVELLQDAPPRGILHHYCRLGFIHWGTSLATTTFTDCRDHWPHACECDSCTVTVGDGVDSHGQFTDIQLAINALGNRGGVVCIGRGFYTVTAGLVLDNTKDKVIIRGMGPATRILFAPPPGATGAFLNIERTQQVRLENVFVVSRGAEALVRITNSNFVRIEDCYLINIPGRATTEGAASRAVEFRGSCSNCEIVRSGLLADIGVSSTSGQVRHLSVRRNEFLVRQVSIFLRQAFDLEIVENRMRGLPREAFIGDINISRETIDAFQVSTWNVFRATLTLGDFQAAGVLVFIGNGIVISRNLIVAQVAVLGLLLLNARVEQNDIVSLVGMLLIFGLLVKFEDNFVLGIFAGIIHLGITADFDCTANEFLGLNGIIWMTLAEFIKEFLGLITNAIKSAGLGSIDPAAVMGALAFGNLQAFGVAVVAKVHRNVFITFSRGIFKTNPVISADISIVDNTFSLCATAGIELGGSERGDFGVFALRPFISLRHLIQSNALAVLGRGIISSATLTQVDQNSVQCPSVALELDAEGCTASNNMLMGLANTTAPPEEGLLILHRDASKAIITGNRLFTAPGHSILIRDDLDDLTIEDNHIEGAKRFGIGTFNEITSLRGASISRNDVRRCRGEVPPATTGLFGFGSQQFGGAIVIGASFDVRFIDNVVTDNFPPPIQGNQVPRWFAVYFEDANNIEISGNSVTNNANVTGVGGSVGAIGLSRVAGVIRLQNNVVRNNGGRALLLGEGQVPLVQRALIQNNHFSAGLNSASGFVLVTAIDSLLFQGNQCTVVTPTPPAGLTVLISATRANITGNVVDFPGPTALRIEASEALVNANSVRSGKAALIVVGTLIGSGPVRVIVTSNLTTGISATSTGGIILTHNFPPP